MGHIGVEVDTDTDTDPGAGAGDGAVTTPHRALGRTIDNSAILRALIRMAVEDTSLRDRILGQAHIAIYPDGALGPAPGSTPVS